MLMLFIGPVIADEKRFIYFISNPPHLIKTARNCLANSLAGSMWNDGQYLTWNHIAKLFNDDLDCGLHLVPKITNEHINLAHFCHECEISCTSFE